MKLQKALVMRTRNCSSPSSRLLSQAFLVKCASVSGIRSRTRYWSTSARVGVIEEAHETSVNPHLVEGVEACVRLHLLAAIESLQSKRTRFRT